MIMVNVGKAISLQKELPYCKFWTIKDLFFLFLHSNHYYYYYFCQEMLPYIVFAYMFNV